MRCFIVVWCMYFMMFFWTSLLGVLRFSNVVNECLWIVPHTHVVDGDEGLIVHRAVFSVWMRGLYSVGFSFFLFSYGNVGEYVVTIGEIYGLCGFW